MTIGSDSIGRTPNDLEISKSVSVGTTIGVGTPAPTPPTVAHISSGVGANGSCIMLIEADADNSNEDANPQIHLRQDGGQLEGALFLRGAVIPNELVLANAVSSGGGISLATKNSGNAIDATRRFLVNIAGNIGIGTPPPSPSTNQLEVDGDTKIDGDIEAAGKAILGNSFVVKRIASGAGNLVSTGAIILAVTDTSAPRTVTIQSADILNEGQLFIVQDEADSSVNAITVKTEGAQAINGSFLDETINTLKGNIFMYSNGAGLIIISRR